MAEHAQQDLGVIGGLFGLAGRWWAAAPLLPRLQPLCQAAHVQPHDVQDCLQVLSAGRTSVRTCTLSSVSDPAADSRVIRVLWLTGTCMLRTSWLPWPIEQFVRPMHQFGSSSHFQRDRIARQCCLPNPPAGNSSLCTPFQDTFLRLIEAPVSCHCRRRTSTSDELGDPSDSPRGCCI